MACARWLCALGVLPPDHRIVLAEATVQDLAYTLRDGVVLCHVASTLDEASINPREVNQRPQMAQFLCLKNIRLFLSACTHTFGLRDSDLFDPSMLYDYTDFCSVLHTLSKLSQCPEVRLARPEVPPWPNRNRRGSSHEEEIIYKRLEDLVDDDTYEEFYYSHHGGNKQYGYVWTGGHDNNASSVSANGAAANRPSSVYYRLGAAQEEDIYADLCLLRTSSSISSSGTQSSRRVSSQSAAARLVGWQFVPRDKKDFCLKELVETEANYVDALNMLRKNFIRPITTISESDKKVVFMNIKELGEIHAGFFTALLDCVKAKPAAKRRVGDVFLEFKDRFLKYGEYCAELPRAQETLDALCAKSDDVAEEVARCEKTASERRYRLRDMLILPMQRILKYHLLLKILSNASSSSPAAAVEDECEETLGAAQAHEAMMDVAEYINEVKRDTEQIHNIRVIQASITGWIMPKEGELKDYGRLRKDGELKVQSHDTTGSKYKIRYVLVFDKVLLMCKTTRGDSYSFKESLKLADYKVQDIRNGDAGSHTPTSSGDVVRRVMRRDSTRWTHSFMLVHVQDTNAYTLVARTAEDKQKWMDGIREALSNICPVQQPTASPSGQHDLQMTTFDKPTSCDHCHKLLKGTLYQGYRCHRCGRSAHKTCLAFWPACGPLLMPPALPPRPPSMQLPVQLANGDESVDIEEDVRLSCDSDNQDKQSLVRQGSDTSNSSLVMAPPMAPFMNGGGQSYSTRSIHPDYINTRLEDHAWFVGEMDRESANGALARYPVGTFLVRCRVAPNGDKLGFALSLKTDTDVKHMRVDTELSKDDDPSLSSLYFFSETRQFRSVVELVSWYSRNSLKECFVGLDNTLRFPLGELSMVQAKYEFAPSAEDTNMLPLQAGEQVTIIDKTDQGWWKAFNGHRIGYVPKDFVVVLDEY